MDIRAARADELPAVQVIDRAAGLMFCYVGMPEIAGFLWPAEMLAAHLEAGQLWVIAGEDGEPAGFLIADLLDGCWHVEQVSVHPARARRGLGRALLDHAAVRALAAGYPAVTLTTFADVPWNAPYYARCGFRVIGDAEVTQGLRAVREREAAAGLDRWPRVCMRRDL